MNEGTISMRGEYEERGEYHRTLDRKWKYYPVYVRKMAFVRKYLEQTASQGKSIDVGCGEGILVEEFREKGFDIVGLDANYESSCVIRGDMTNMSFANQTFDLLTALDVIEHLDFEQQDQALAEIRRVLKPGGRALLSIPNLAHFASRISFLLTGRLLRTSTIDRHKGDRPIQEYLDLCKRHGLRVVRRTGLFPTLPLLTALTCLCPSRVVGLHRLYNTLPMPAAYSFLNIVEVERPIVQILSMSAAAKRTRDTGVRAQRAA